MGDDSELLPPADFAHRSLSTVTIRAGTDFSRMHRTSHGPVFFNTGNDYRFNSPDGSYGVFYVGDSDEAAFAETMLREPGKDYVAYDELKIRSISHVTLNRDALMAQLHGNGLYQNGITTRHVSAKYEITQEWSRAIHDHPDRVDGIEYRSIRDNSLICWAFFNRIDVDDLSASPPQRLTDAGYQHRLAKMLDRYGVALG